MSTGRENAAQDRFGVVAVLLFGKKEVASYPTREQAEWKADELNAHAERNPRGYVRYLVRPLTSGGRGPSS